MFNQGRDFKQNVVLPVQDQVELLIIQATSLENLCQCFIGWYVVCRFLMFRTDCPPPGVHSGRLGGGQGKAKRL
jgi:hypothetical protein